MCFIDPGAPVATCTRTRASGPSDWPNPHTCTYWVACDALWGERISVCASTFFSEADSDNSFPEVCFTRFGLVDGLLALNCPGTLANESLECSRYTSDSITVDSRLPVSSMVSKCFVDEILVSTVETFQELTLMSTRVSVRRSHVEIQGQSLIPYLTQG